MEEARSGRNGAARRRAGRLGAPARDAIGQALRDHYDALLTEPLPERIRELVASLDEAPAGPVRGKARTGKG